MTKAIAPSDLLAAKIVDRLIEQKLVRAERRDAMVAKIAAGSIKGDDWRLEIDLATTKIEKA